MNVQRNVIYAERRKVLDGEDLQPSIRRMIEEYVSGTIAEGFAAEPHPDIKQINEILAPFGRLFLVPGELRFTPEEPQASRRTSPRKRCSTRLRRL